MPKSTLKVRPDGRLVKNITDPVTGKRVFFYGKTEREINRKIMEYSEKTEKGRTFAEVADEWWEEAEPDLSFQTVKSYKPAMRRAVESFGTDYIKSIKSQDIMVYLKSLVRQGYSAKTVSNHRLIANLIFKYAVYHEDIENNPCVSVETPSGGSKQPRTSASAKDESIVRQSASVWLFPFFALYTGMRKGEILALKWEDIDFDNNLIHVTKSVAYKLNQPIIKSPKTAAGVRTVPLLLPLRSELLKINRKSQSEYVFSSNGGKTPLTNRCYMTRFEQYKKKTGITCTAHQLRHSFATIAFECGVPVKSVQEILGHKQLSTTMDIYTDFRKKSLDEAANLLNSKMQI